jgi:PAS domain S-box-containing protein
MTVQNSEMILIIDDDDAKRHAISKILRKAGYSITQGSTGAEALRLAAEKPALIILDVKLPDVSGFEVCRQLKEDPATANIPVLHISTTFVDIEDRIHGLEGGADGYLTDVQEPLELVATVKSLLRARRAEEAAQISARQWQVTFDAINDGVVLLDRVGRALQINSAMETILGHSWNDLSGRTIQELLAVPDIGEHSPFARMLESGQREAVELTLSARWLRVTFDPIRDSAGLIKGGICIASDVTDRRRLEEELRRRAEELAAADQRKDEFLAMLAHELRNPLAPIANVLETIRLDRSDLESTNESLDIARRQVGHMARLLDDLLDVSRFTRGKIELRRVPVELGSVLKQAVETSSSVIKASGHQFDVIYPTVPIWLQGDPTRLSQIVSNLLNNAAKYTDRGGRITLSAAREEDEAIVRVRDNGIGLSAEMLPRVFDLFAQEDRSLDRAQGGLGIGLTLVQSLAQLHGGSVGVESRGLGKGSEFIVRLPVYNVQSHDPETQDPMPGSGAPVHHSLRLLVVDDSEDSARSLARILTLWGNDVRIAHDGTTAIETIASESLDLVLLDIGLPGMDGYQVAEQLRDQMGASRPILVALTGYGQVEDMVRSRNAGFDDHFVKPVNLDRLQKMLSDVNFLSRRFTPGAFTNDSVYKLPPL